MKKQINNKITYRSEIIYALSSLGGMASLHEINDFIKKRNVLPGIHTNINWSKNVSAEIQRHCSQTKSYAGEEDLFYSVYGLYEGYWGLISMMPENEHASVNPIELRQIKRIRQDISISNTEKEMLINARIGQGVFRERLLAKYDRKCIITGISDDRLLLASHIKPWRSSNNVERINEENGLLLSPLYDKMFDLGLISFNDNMRIIVSKKLSEENIKLINIDYEKCFIVNPSSDLRKNMYYHRKKIFKK